MIDEITNHGPIACSCSITNGLKEHKTGIFKDETGRKVFDHEVEIVGYGVENGTKYWHVRNSWGTHYADGGFLKVIRGVNNLAIETN